MYSAELAVCRDVIRLMCDPDMCRFINTGMHRDKAAQHLRIGRVDDRIDREPCDIALPDRNPIGKGIRASLISDRGDV